MVCAHWLRHTDKLIWRWKWRWKTWSFWVWLYSESPCTDLRGPFALQTCICMFKIICAVFVYSSLFFTSINCPMSWQGDFAWKNRCLKNYVSTTSEVVFETDYCSQKSLMSCKIEQHNYWNGHGWVVKIWLIAESRSVCLAFFWYNMEIIS